MSIVAYIIIGLCISFIMFGCIVWFDDEEPDTRSLDYNILYFIVLAGCLMLGMMWIVAIPVGLILGVLYLISRIVVNMVGALKGMLNSVQYDDEHTKG